MRPSLGVVSVSEILAYLERDRYFDLKEAAKYCAMSPRSFRRVFPEHLRFRITKRKVICKRSEVDLWLEEFRQAPERQEDSSRIADEAVAAIFAE